MVPININTFCHKKFLLKYQRNDTLCGYQRKILSLSHGSFVIKIPPLLKTCLPTSDSLLILMSKSFNIMFDDTDKLYRIIW